MAQYVIKYYNKWNPNVVRIKIISSRDEREAVQKLFFICGFGDAAKVISVKLVDYNNYKEG